MGINAVPMNVAGFNSFVKEQLSVLGPAVKGGGIKLCAFYPAPDSAPSELAVIKTPIKPSPLLWFSSASIGAAMSEVKKPNMPCYLLKDSLFAESRGVRRLPSAAAAMV